MTDSAVNRPPSTIAPTTVAEILKGLEPMGDLTQFAIGDLSPEEADEFFAILENA